MTSVGVFGGGLWGRIVSAVLVLGLVAFAALAVSCTSAEAPSIHIVPDGGQVVAGQSLQLVATRHYSDGRVENVTHLVDWTSSSDNTLRLVSPALKPGLVSALTESATVFITAKDPESGEFTTSTFSVARSQLSRIDVNPSPAVSLVRGQTHSVTAIGTYTDGSTADITDKVLWSSSNEAVAAVSNLEQSRGTVTAVAPGNTSITATDSVTGLVGSTLLFVNGEAATLVAITVGPNPESVGVGGLTQFSATGIFSDGSTQSLTTLVGWSSSKPTVATIDSAGLAKAVTAGDTTITATANGTAIRASALLTVTQ
jgi:hypothetical protein